jgi:hypothetical protein
MPSILSANTLSSGYDVDNSARLSGDSYLSKTPSNANYLHATFSFWVKRSKLGTDQGLFGRKASNQTAHGTFCHFTATSDQLLINFRNSGGTSRYYIITHRVFRDISAWYHIHIVIDGDNGTQADRIQLYINGVRETAFDLLNTPSANDYEISTFNNDGGTDFTVGRSLRSQNNTFYNFEGYMAEFHCSVAAAYPPTEFGEFDEDSPSIWKPKKADITYGNDGFYLEFKETGTSQNSSGIGADTSGEDHHYAVTNLAATDQSTDTCTNNGCTWNTLYRSGATFTEGNLVYQAPGSNPVFGSLTTFGVSAGKWYAECKYHAGSNHYGVLGVADEVFATLTDLGSATNTDLGKTGAALGSHPSTCTVAYVINTGKVRNNNNNQNYGSGGGDGDIINIALDRDNRKVYFGINGTYENSGDPAAGSNGFDISSQVSGNEYFLGVTNDTGASETVLDFNFGGGFGQTAVSSANADANGHGNFEYAVPSGFFAWNTKNLAEQG